MQINQEQTEELRSILKKADQILNQITGSGDEKSRKYWANRMGILATVMLEGGVVTSERWIEIGKEHGYNPQGLGGYFAGRRSSMVKVGGDKRAITESGNEDVIEWLDEENDSKPYPDQLEKFKLLLED